MPAKILCPYLPDQLREVYSRKSIREIAADLTANAYPVSFSTVSSWLKEAGIERKVFSPYAAGKIDSPYTPARLQELYWREGKSTAGIGELAGPLVGLNQKVQQATVTRWLKEAGVTLRTAAESQAVRAKLHPQQFQRGAEAMRAALTPEMRREIGKANSERLKKYQSKGIKAAAALKKAQRAWETRECCWPECSAPITKPAKMFRNAPDRTYCCSSHASKAAHWLRKIGLAPPINYRTHDKQGEGT